MWPVTNICYDVLGQDIKVTVFAIGLSRFFCIICRNVPWISIKTQDFEQNFIRLLSSTFTLLLSLIRFLSI